MERQAGAFFTLSDRVATGNAAYRRENGHSYRPGRGGHGHPPRARSRSRDFSNYERVGVGTGRDRDVNGRPFVGGTEVGRERGRDPHQAGHGENRGPFSSRLARGPRAYRSSEGGRGHDRESAPGD